MGFLVERPKCPLHSDCARFYYKNGLNCHTLHNVTCINSSSHEEVETISLLLELGLAM